MKKTDQKRVGPHELRRLLFRILDSRPSGSPVIVRAWPLGFPIVEASYAVQERVPQPTGLVRRAVLEAVCRFGPCSAADVDAMLGIGEDLVVTALRELATAALDLTVAQERYSAGPRSRALLASGEFTRVVEHRRKFLVNGLTDRLLPVDFWRRHDEWRIFPDPNAPESPFRTADGRPTEIAARLSDRGAPDGFEDLQRLASGSDREEKQRLGIPPGACEILGAATVHQVSWVGAWAMLHPGGSAEIVSTASPAVTLLEGPVANVNYLQEAVQGLRGSAFHIPFGVPEAVTRRWPRDVVVNAGDVPGEVTAGLPEWAGPSEEEAGHSRRRIEEDLVRGRAWDWHSGWLLSVSPAAPYTAAFVAVHRGARELRAEVRRFRPNEQPPWRLADWWPRWLERFVATLPANAHPGEIPVSSLVAAAEHLRDGEFLERLDNLGSR